MILALLFLIISFGAFYAGGCLRGLFECVLLFDSVDDFLGPRWAFELFTSNKDRNKDGRVDFWEKHFPNDGGHRAKLFELLLYALGCNCYAIAFFSASFYLMTISDYCIYLIGFVSIFTIWWIMSIGFLTTFKKYRYGKAVAKFDH